MSKDLKAQHDAYIAGVKARGEPTLTYQTPCCGNVMEDRAAPPGAVWDTLATCPHCGRLYMKITTAECITGSIPPGLPE